MFLAVKETFHFPDILSGEGLCLEFIFIYFQNFSPHTSCIVSLKSKYLFAQSSASRFTNVFLP